MGKAARKRLFGDNYIEERIQNGDTDALHKHETKMTQIRQRNEEKVNKKYWESKGFVVEPDGRIHLPNQ